MLSDEALHERLRRGELGAFDALYERHKRPLFGFVARLLSDRSEAEDVLHEVFLSLLRSAPTGLRSVRAWLFEVARNACSNRLRARGRAARALVAHAAEPPAFEPGPEHALEALEASEALRRAVERLPPPLAALYAMRARGLSYEELAQALGLPLGTVKSRLHETVARLREETKHEV